MLQHTPTMQLKIEGNDILLCMSQPPEWRNAIHAAVFEQLCADFVFNKFQHELLNQKTLDAAKIYIHQFVNELTMFGEVVEDFSGWFVVDPPSWALNLMNEKEIKEVDASLKLFGQR